MLHCKLRSPACLSWALKFLSTCSAAKTIRCIERQIGLQFVHVVQLLHECL